MCGCTLYDSPTCGHSWISMSQPCGFLSDLVSCPSRQTYQTLIAPPYTCPVCNGGFADQETMEMVQGPWGCNQMIRNHVGGNHTVPGLWGNARFMPDACEGSAITSGAMSGAVMPMRHVHGGFAYDDRLTGPYVPHATLSHASMVVDDPTMPGPAMMANRTVVCDGYDGYDDGGRRKRRRHKSHYKYKYTDRPATNCTIM